MSDKMTPEIRFKGFSDDWEQRKLGDILKVNSGRDYKHLHSGNIPVYGTGGYMLSVDDKLSQQDGIGIGRKGTIDRPQYLSAPFWTVDTLFYLTPLNNHKLNFIQQITYIINWKKYSEQTGVPSLSKNSIEKIDINVPEITEQTKIGELLRTLDTTIALHQFKIKKIQKIKQGLLHVITPKRGQLIPFLRFTNFSSSWEQRQLDSTGEIITGSTPSTLKSENYSTNGSPWVTPTDIISKTTINTAKKLSKVGESASRMVPANTILVTSIASIGKNTMLLVPGSFNQQINGIVPDNNNDSYFLLTMSELWSRTMKSFASSGIMQIVNKSEFSKMKFPFPDTKEEQMKIGYLFRQLDNTIALHQTKIKKLQQIKKAYLQKMFI
ncbi:restriction endonuclease subunit S [Dellaglioa carnosa]|uniref:Restriction endonuclease subunit S n=1 Tax=Dellaglioa carnosa TaxID=2995136 RepID=A0ABT4JMC4_9LACO|nr:restriction endonuclease subunit S [Dellaglioa carnosa]MCZ2491517.1 restriction endonuclease subunit S [Dellaglioa carnosa]MCZ2494594.1 restriction endonuclease subunit S [Dellaglioa carnosa]MDK1731457.1 restriction endonuclease subunit S [Dellaglioa carnosa]